MKRLLPLLALFALVAFVGCGATPRERVIKAERIYGSTARLADRAVDNDLIRDEATLDALDVASTEANEALKDANAKVQADQPITSDFYLDRIESALERWIKLLTESGVK